MQIVWVSNVYIINCITSTIENTDENAGCEFLGFKYTTALLLQ